MTILLHFKVLHRQFCRLVCAVMVFALSGFVANAQDRSCGTDIDQQHLDLLRQRHSDLQQFSFKTNDTIYIPIVAHIIRRDNGTGGLQPGDVANELIAVNDHYAPAMVQFFLCDSIHFLNSTQYYSFQKTVDEEFTADLLDVDSVLNVYFVGRLYKVSSGGDTSELCGYSFFPPSVDRLFMDNNCSTNGSTLAHEIGHYLSLLHTHDRSFGAELVDGSNCDSAGDLFCDTPADPNLSGLVTNGCNYIGNDTDGNGDQYNPDTGNLMSYSRKSCRDHFSQEQIAAIHYSAMNDRNYLVKRVTADFTESPNTYEVFLTNHSVNAESYLWSFGDGTTSTDLDPHHVYADSGRYEICLYTSNSCKSLVYCDSIDINCSTLNAAFAYADTGVLGVSFATGLTGNYNYTWHFGDGFLSADQTPVHFYNEPGEYTVSLVLNNSCGTATETKTITVTGPPVGVSQVNMKSVQVFPNPFDEKLTVDAGNELTILSLELMDLSGKSIYVVNNLHSSRAKIDGINLASGCYLLTIQTDQGRFYTKLIKN